MLSERTKNFIDQMEKFAADSSSGQQQRKYKTTIKKHNNTGAGTALGSAIGTFAGKHAPRKYRAMSMGLGALVGAGAGHIIGKRSVNSSYTKSHEVNVKREEKKSEHAQIPRLNMLNRVR